MRSVFYPCATTAPHIVIIACIENRFQYSRTLILTRISSSSWSVSQSDLASIPAKGVVYSQGPSDETSHVRPHQILGTKGKTGHVDVTASLKTSGSYLIGGFGSISDTLSIRLVNDATIVPEQVSQLAVVQTVERAHFI